MRSTELRRIINGAALAVMMTFAGSTMAGSVAAQTTTDQGYNQGATTDDTDNDQDWGWIGLLGLAGLLGLRRRDRADHVDHTARRP